MLRQDKIKNSFYKEVGFNTPTLSLTLSDNTSLDLDSDNVTSNSGMWFDDINFVSIQNIFDCHENKDITNAQFNAYLKRLVEDSAVQFCSKVIAGESDHLQSVNLFPYEKAFEDTLTPNNKFVGFRIETYSGNDRIAKIPWIELSLNEAKEITIYLFNSNLKTAIKSKSITTVANEATVMNLVDDNGKPWLITDDTTYKGGNYYIGYFEDDLGTAEAYEKNYEESNIQKYVRDYCITPVRLNHTSNVIDVTEGEETSDVFGLNMGFEVYKDYTELIINNKQSFLEGYQYQVAEKVLNLIKSSTRSNGIADRLKEEDMIGEFNALLYGNSTIEGVQGALKRNVDTLKKMFFYKPRIFKETLK